MLRGEVWRYEPVIARSGTSTLRLILTADELLANPDERVIQGAHVLDHDRGDLLSVGTSLGWVAMRTCEPVLRRRLVEWVGALAADEMEAVEFALRAMFGL